MDSMVRTFLCVLRRLQLLLITVAVAAWRIGLCISAQMLLIGPGTICISPDISCSLVLGKGAATAAKYGQNVYSILQCMKCIWFQAALLYLSAAVATDHQHAYMPCTAGSIVLSRRADEELLHILHVIKD